MPQDVRLLKTHRNAVLRLVQESRLKPADFRWDDTVFRDGYDVQFLVSKFVHEPTKFYFMFGPHADEYSPGFNRRTDSRRAEEQLEWRLPLVGDWLTYVKREYEAHDLWELLRQDTKLLQVASSPDLPNDSFTEPEKQSIRDQLAEVKQHLISVHHLQLQQAEIIDQGFSYLDDSLNRLGKKDWLNNAIGALMGIALGAAFSSTVAQDMFDRFMSAVYPLYDSIMKLIG